MIPPDAAVGGDRLAKVIARSGLCSRRDAEGWIKDGRVVVNGKVIRTPAFNVAESDKIEVDGAPLAAREGTRVWLYHKPAGLVVTEKDPEGRTTIFEKLSEHGLPRVVSIGRLDINTEGLLLLTNDGGLKRVLELPATGWLRRYRVRAHGSVTQAALDRLKDGIEIDGIKYGAIEATFERQQGSNVWLLVALREGKNREVKNVLGALGLEVNRLIRVSFGPFQLGDIPIGAVETVKARVLREQLGKRLADAAGADFESEAAVARPVRGREMSKPGNTVAIGNERFRFTDRANRERPEDAGQPPPRPDRPGRPDMKRKFAAPRPPAAPAGPPRKIHFDDGRESQDFTAKSYGKRPPRGTEGASGADRPPHVGGPRAAETRAPRSGPRPDRPQRPDGDRPRAPRRPDGDAPRPQRRSGPPRDVSAAPAGARPPYRASGPGRPARPDGDVARPPRRSGPPRAGAPGPVDGRPPRKGPPRSGPRPGGGPGPGGSRGGKPARPPRNRA